MSSTPLAVRVVESMADAVIAGDTSGAVTLWNAGAEQMFGWPAHEVLGDPFPGVPDQEAEAELADALAKVFDGEHVSLTTKRRRADGGLFDAWMVLSPLRRRAGARVDGWVAVVRDATRQRAVQRDLRRRVELVGRLASVIAGLNSDLDLYTLLRRISESGAELLAGDGAAYVVLDGDELEVAAVFGLSHEMIGQRFPFSESAVAALVRTGRPSMAASNAEFPNSVRVVQVGNAYLPRLAVASTRLDGSLSGGLYVFFAAEQRALSRAELGVLELLAEAAGTAIANARAYERQREQREHERAVIDGTADGMAVLDADGLVRHWNPAARELTGVDDTEALGRPIPFPIAELGVQFEHQLPSGRWLEIICAPIGETGESVVDFRDITRSKLIEQSKDLFLAVTSHELRTPITVVQGYAATLLTHWTALTDSERRDLVERISQRTRALGALVEQLLLGSRAGSTESTPDPVVVDVAGLLHTVVSGLSTVAPLHELVLDVPPDLPPVFGDPSSIEIALSQLLENAVKYSPNGGEVTVVARVDGERLRIEVLDRGLGIPDGEHERVFERFYQVGGERRRFGGVGLGLYIVRRLIEASGGQVLATARPGGGSRFVVSLPFVAPGS